MSVHKAVNRAKSFHYHNVLSNVRTKNIGSHLPPWVCRAHSPLIEKKKRKEEELKTLLGPGV